MAEIIPELTLLNSFFCGKQFFEEVSGKTDMLRVGNDINSPCVASNLEVIG